MLSLSELQSFGVKNELTLLTENNVSKYLTLPENTEAMEMMMLKKILDFYLDKEPKTFSIHRLILCQLCVPDAYVIMSSEEVFEQHRAVSHVQVKVEIPDDLSNDEDSLPFKCDLCAKSYNFERGLKRHKSQVHFITDTGSSAVHECAICGVVTNQREGLRRHVRRSHDVEAILSDPDQSETVTDFLKSILHMCQFCHLPFLSLNAKMAHITSEHPSESAVKCPLCAHISTSKLSMNRHYKRMHPGEKYFDEVSVSCQSCGEKFPHVNSLAFHVTKQHPELKNFKSKIVPSCSECDKNFTTFKGWKAHMNKEHGATTKEFNCDKCGKTFGKSNALKLHERMAHAGGEDTVKKFPYKCKLCDRRFALTEHRFVAFIFRQMAAAKTSYNKIHIFFCFSELSTTKLITRMKTFSSAISAVWGSTARASCRLINLLTKAWCSFAKSAKKLLL